MQSHVVADAIAGDAASVQRFAAGPADVGDIAGLHVQKVLDPLAVCLWASTMGTESACLVRLWS